MLLYYLWGFSLLEHEAETEPVTSSVFTNWLDVGFGNPQRNFIASWPISQSASQKMGNWKGIAAAGARPAHPRSCLKVKPTWADSVPCSCPAKMSSAVTDATKFGSSSMQQICRDCYHIICLKTFSAALFPNLLQNRKAQGCQAYLTGVLL